MEKRYFPIRRGSHWLKQYHEMPEKGKPKSILPDGLEVYEAASKDVQPVEYLAFCFPTADAMLAGGADKLTSSLRTLLSSARKLIKLIGNDHFAMTKAWAAVSSLDPSSPETNAIMKALLQQVARAGISAEVVKRKKTNENISAVTKGKTKHRHVLALEGWKMLRAKWLTTRKTDNSDDDRTESLHEWWGSPEMTKYDWWRDIAPTSLRRYAEHKRYPFRSSPS